MIQINGSDDKLKKLKSNIITFIEIGVNLALLPLFYVKFFHEVSILPGYDADGNFITIKQDHYYSIVDNLRYNPIRFVHISVALIVMSVIYCILSLFIKHKNMKIASHVFAICSVAFFLLVLFIASLVRKNY